MTTTRTTTPANDNTPRPAAFDRDLADHMNFMLWLANRLVGAHDAMELVNDTSVMALSRWHYFKPGWKFSTWLGVVMTNVIAERQRTARSRKRAARTVSIDGVDLHLSAPARQDDLAMLAEVLAAMPAGRGGEVLIRRAMGEDLAEIGHEMGVSRQRVHQLEIDGRRRLLAALGERRVA